jgi:ribosome-associated translation inhibitor RaiA
MDVSAAAEARIREEASKLGRYFDHIIGCRVVVEAPHRHHVHGNGFRIKINITVPGSEIAVNHEPSLHSTVAGSETGGWEKHLEAQPDHKDIYVSIRDAFAAARRRLEDYARLLRGDVKHHTAGEQGPDVA